MPIARPKDVVDEIDRLYPFAQGSGHIILDEETTKGLANLLKLIQRMPPELQPQGFSGETFRRALTAVREGVQEARKRKASGQNWVNASIGGSQADGWLNPVAMLRRELVPQVNLTRREIRRKILELTAARETATPHDPFFPDYHALGSVIDGYLTLAEVQRQMKILKSDNQVDLIESHSNGCAVKLTPAGWKALEEPLGSSEDQGIIFISCGQFTEEEKQLGETLSQAIDERTPHTGYFAQRQSSLDGLSKHIFGALNQAVGLVAVMHHRGLVKTPYGDHLRASVWVEQEIAIAAFLTQALDRDLPVILYLQEGIALEGVRQQLMLNPVYFKDNTEVLKDFRERLGNGLFQASAVAASL